MSIFKLNKSVRNYLWGYMIEKLTRYSYTWFDNEVELNYKIKTLPFFKPPMEGFSE